METFEEILIPEVVHREITKGSPIGKIDAPVIESAISKRWIGILKTKIRPAIPNNLGEDERDAISLAYGERSRIDW